MKISLLSRITGLVALIGMFLLSSTAAWAQTSADSQPAGNTVSGVVVDATGYPLIGVAVLIKGTTVGSSTDLDGKFEFVLPSSLGGARY